MQNVYKLLMIVGFIFNLGFSAQAAPSQSLVPGSNNNTTHQYLLGWSGNGFTAQEALSDCQQLSTSVLLPNYQADYSAYCKQFFGPAFGKAGFSAWANTCSAPVLQNHRYYSMRTLQITCVKP